VGRTGDGLWRGPMHRAEAPDTAADLDRFVRSRIGRMTEAIPVWNVGSSSALGPGLARRSLASGRALESTLLISARPLIPSASSAYNIVISLFAMGKLGKGQGGHVMHPQVRDVLFSFRIREPVRERTATGEGY